MAAPSLTFVDFGKILDGTKSQTPHKSALDSIPKLAGDKDDAYLAIVNAAAKNALAFMSKNYDLFATDFRRATGYLADKIQDANKKAAAKAKAEATLKEAEAAFRTHDAEAGQKLEKAAEYIADANKIGTDSNEAAEATALKEITEKKPEKGASQFFYLADRYRIMRSRCVAVIEKMALEGEVKNAAAKPARETDPAKRKTKLDHLREVLKVATAVSPEELARLVQNSVAEVPSPRSPGSDAFVEEASTAAWKGKCDVGVRLAVAERLTEPKIAGKKAEWLHVQVRDDLSAIDAMGADAFRDRMHAGFITPVKLFLKVVAGEKSKDAKKAALDEMVAKIDDLAKGMRAKMYQIYVKDNNFFGPMSRLLQQAIDENAPKAAPKTQ